MNPAAPTNVEIFPPRTYPRPIPVIAPEDVGRYVDDFEIESGTEYIDRLITRHLVQQLEHSRREAEALARMEARQHRLDVARRARLWLGLSGCGLAFLSGALIAAFG